MQRDKFKRGIESLSAEEYKYLKLREIVLRMHTFTIKETVVGAN